MGVSPPLSSPAHPTDPAVDSAQQSAWRGDCRVSGSREDSTGGASTSYSPSTSSTSPLHRPPSLQGSGDGTGSHRATSKARQRPVGSKQHKLLPAEPAREARPCITLPAEGLALAPHKPRGSSSAARAHHFLHRK